MSTTPTHATAIPVGPHRIDVQCFATAKQRDRAVPGLAAMTEPVPVTSWPLSPDQIATLAAEKLRTSGGRIEEVGDCIWAIKAATIDRCDTHYWREARTDAERADDQHRARRAYLRGELE